MAAPKRFRELEALFASPVPAVDEALEARRLASPAARGAELEAAHACERAEQARLRELVRATEALR